jgi:uncharacterized membrane protein YoaK (UPF0700 family)
MLASYSQGSDDRDRKACHKKTAARPRDAPLAPHPKPPADSVGDPEMPQERDATATGHAMPDIGANARRHTIPDARTPWRGLLLATFLAALAGMVDAVGFLRLGHVFVSYMSGNSTQFAVALGRGNADEASSIAELIGLFVVGAAMGQVLAHAAGRWHLTAVLGVVAMLLGVAAATVTAPPLMAVAPMVLAMGSLNAAMHRAGRLGVSLTYVTGTLVKLGQGLGDFLIWRKRSWDWLAQTAPWLGIVAGAAVAGALYSRIGGHVVWVAVGVACLLALFSAFIPEPE